MVPDEAPSVPLVEDLARERKRLRLKQEAAASELDLDLRKERDRDKSHLLHRLQLLEVHWGEPRPTSQNALGTFAEKWRLQWTPELSIALIEASTWGTTIADAAAARAAALASEAVDLPALTSLLSDVLDADLGIEQPCGADAGAAVQWQGGDAGIGPAVQQVGGTQQ